MLAGAPPASITVVLDDNYPPYVFRDASGQLQGLLVDSWALWQRKTGIEARLLAMDWGKAQAVMAARQADLIDTLFKTPERERLYLFSRPYADLDVVIAHDREIGGVGTPHTLRGFAVGVKDGDACISYLKARGVDQLRPYPSYQALIEAAGRDELKVFCIDRASRGKDVQVHALPPGCSLRAAARLGVGDNTAFHCLSHRKQQPSSSHDSAKPGG